MMMMMMVRRTWGRRFGIGRDFFLLGDGEGGWWRRDRGWGGEVPFLLKGLRGPGEMVRSIGAGDVR